MPCPRCNGLNIIRAGHYHTKRSSIAKQRLRCQDCKKTFIVRNGTYKRKIKEKIRREIIKLYRTKKPYKNKFDALNKATYSTREIAMRLDVSKSFVHQVISKKTKEWKVKYGGKQRP